MSSREGKNSKGSFGRLDELSWKEGEGVKKASDVFQENIIKNFEKNNSEVVVEVDAEIISDEVAQEVVEDAVEENPGVEVLDVEEDLNSSSVSNFDNLKRQAKRTAAYKKKKAFVPTPVAEVDPVAEIVDAPKLKGAKRNLNANRKEVKFEDDSFKSKMPNPEDLEGVLFNDFQLTEEDIAKSKTINALLAKVDKSKGFQGRRDFFDEGLLRDIIEGVRDKKLAIEYVTKNGGLRKKVFDLLKGDVITEEVKPDAVKAEEVLDEATEIVEEVADEIEVVDDDETKYEIEIQTPVETKEEKPDTNVFKIQKKAVEVETKEELPDLEALGLISSASKNPKEKPKIFVDDESDPKEATETFNRAEKLSQLEKTLSEKRKQLVAVHKESEILNTEYEKKMKNPFKKFLVNAFGSGIKEFNKKIDGFEAVRLDYQKTVDEMVEEKILKRMDYLMSLRVNNPERKQYEPKDFLDVEKYLDLKNLVGDDKERVKELVEQSKYGNISLSEILKDKIFRGLDVDLAKRNYIFKILEKEIREEVAVEENELIDRLLSL
ncbi:MAG: hypothetical protein WC087_04040 [Candidatus Paceibacterota bacterium]